MRWQYNNPAAQYSDILENDSITRAISIASGEDYKKIYELLNEYMKRENLDEKYIKNSWLKVRKDAAKELLKAMQYTWVPTMKFANGCKTRLRDGELPMGTLICNISKNLTCVVDGIIQDVYDPSRKMKLEDGTIKGTRAVYGYWFKETN